MQGKTFAVKKGQKFGDLFSGRKDINYIDRNAHIGYWIGKEHRNKGFASEAVSLLSSFCREELKLTLDELSEKIKNGELKELTSFNHSHHSGEHH